MQQTVAILLNEREPKKKEICDALEAELKAEGITPSRFESSPKLAEVIKAAKPSVIVLDYILEDYGTGLDLLEECLSEKSLHNPQCIFLTDEPSLQVAVAAMKLGATDYLLSTDVHAVSECSKTIKGMLAKLQQANIFRQTVRRYRKKKDLVIASEAMESVLEQLEIELKKKQEVIVFVGERGVGKKTLARLGIKELDKLPLSIDLNTEITPIPDVLGRSLQTFEVLEGGLTHACFLFEDVLLSSIEIVKTLSQEVKSISERLGHSPFPIFVTTSDIRVAEAFLDLFSGKAIQVPSLGPEREAEIGQLVQKFLFEASADFKVDLPKLSAKELGWFTEQPWQQNISQMKRVIETYVAAQKVVSGDTATEKLERILAMDSSALLLKDQLLQLQEDPTAVIETLAQARGDYSTCARILGCSVADVFGLIKGFEEPSR